MPFHPGAIDYFRSIGAWGEAEDAHNDRLLERQAVLSRAWQTHRAEDLRGDSAVAAWYATRAQALQAAGFDPVWRSIATN